MERKEENVMNVVIEYYYNDFTDVEKFLEKMSKLKKEYRLNCTLRIFNSTHHYQDFQEFYKLP